MPYTFNSKYLEFKGCRDCQSRMNLLWSVSNRLNNWCSVFRLYAMWEYHQHFINLHWYYTVWPWRMPNMDPTYSFVCLYTTDITTWVCTESITLHNIECVSASTFTVYMTSFICYVNTIVVKLLIYFNSHMRIAEQIIDNIPKWLHVFIKDRGAYKHKTTQIVSFHIILLVKY